jgi:hypothetical protein
MTVEGLRRRRPETLADLLSAYGRELQAVAYLILRDRGEAEGVVIETLLTAFEHGGSIRDERALRAWLRRVATNKAVGTRRKTGRLIRLDLTPDTRVNAADYPYLADFAWAANGRDAWLLFGTAPDGGRGADGVVSLSLSKPDGRRQEYSRLHVSDGNFAILGVGQSADGLPIVAIGSRNSLLRTFVAARGGELNAGSPGYGIGTDETAWFAGWAGQQPDYDPD